jgi:hypothetical protein
VVHVWAQAVRKTAREYSSCSVATAHSLYRRCTAFRPDCLLDLSTIDVYVRGVVGSKLDVAVVGRTEDVMVSAVWGRSTGFGDRSGCKNLGRSFGDRVCLGYQSMASNHFVAEIQSCKEKGIAPRLLVSVSGFVVEGKERPACGSRCLGIVSASSDRRRRQGACLG